MKKKSMNMEKKITVNWAVACNPNDSYGDVSNKLDVERTVGILPYFF